MRWSVAILPPAPVPAARQMLDRPVRKTGGKDRAVHRGGKFTSAQAA